MASKISKLDKVPFKYNNKKYKGYLLSWKNLSSDFDYEYHDIFIILVPKLRTVFRREIQGTRGGSSSEKVEILLDFSSEI